MRCRRRRRRTPIAATLLFFCLIGLPIIWFAGAISVDFVRVLSAHRGAGQIADASAVAGATQYLPNDPDDPYQDSFRLDANAARRVAGDLIAEATGSGMDRHMTITRSRISVSQGGGATPATVTVTLDYEVRGLIFLQLADDLDPDARLARGTITRSAFVCEPGRQSYTYLGNCTRAGA